MGCVTLIMLLATVLPFAVGITVNETTAAGNLTEKPSNATARRGRHIQEIIELPPPGKKTKRQIITIPPSVSKVKFVQPPLSLRHNRSPQQFGRYPGAYRRGGPWRPPNGSYQKDPEFGNENSFPYDPKKVKRNLKKPILKEMNPEEYYRDEEYEFDGEVGKNRPRLVKKHKSVVKIKRKKPKQNILGEYLGKFESEGSPSPPEEGGFESSKLHYGGTEDNQSFQGHDPSGSTIHMRQVPPPNLFPQDPPKQPMTTGQVFDGDFLTGMSVKNLPTGRRVQALFSQQYTTHNPHVTTNFGLGLPNGVRGSYVDAAPHDFPQQGKYSQPVVAASNQVVTSLPVGAPGIEVIQPPQFRDVTVSHPSQPSRLMSPLPQQREETSSQKATIRDILEQDCPSFEAKGFCDSPPRYPMDFAPELTLHSNFRLQIRTMMKKCASLMEAMNTQPFDEPHDIYSFAKRSGDQGGRENKSVSMDLGLESPSSWSRSSSGDLTACTSDLDITEPGYAREVNSERWFVVVQHPDTTIQRIATDTCRNPGKPCGGLSELKCSKVNSLPSKSTRCVQRYTYQRLISWDPELPEECPRMRVFRFPSACVCHLGLV